jgi:hypothetical protein
MEEEFPTQSNVQSPRTPRKLQQSLWDAFWAWLLSVIFNYPTPAPVPAPVPVPAPIAPTPTTPAPSPPKGAGEPVVLINSGGGSYIDSKGWKWEADKYFSGGNAYSDTSQVVAGTNSQEIYQTERWGIFGYEIPLTAGNYEVVLHFAELYVGKVGERVFDILIEDKLFPGVDIVKLASGKPWKAVTFKSTQYVSDGALSIKFSESSPKKENPKLSGIEVVALDNNPSPPVSCYGVSAHF